LQAEVQEPIGPAEGILVEQQLWLTLVRIDDVLLLGGEAPDLLRFELREPRSILGDDRVVDAVEEG